MAENLKEYLVSLGFKIDDSSFKKFEQGLESVSKKAAELGTVAIASATAVGAAIVKISDHMEDLYYISQRTGATVENIQGLQFAAEQVGLSAGAATGALESFKATLRSNPGTEGLLNSLGVQTKDLQGHAIDTEKVFMALIGRLKTMPFYLGQQYGQMFGIDPKTLLMLEQGYEQAGKAADDFKARQRAAGIDADDLAKKSRDFGNELGHLESDFGILSERMEQDFLPIATKVVDWIDRAVQFLNNIDKSTNGWAVTLTTVGATAVGLFAAKLALAVLGLGGVASKAPAAVGAIDAVGAAAAKNATKLGFLRTALNAGLGLSLGLGAIDQLQQDADKTPEERAKSDAAGQNSFGKSAFGWIPGLGGVDWSKPIGTPGGLFGGKTGQAVVGGVQDAGKSVMAALEKMGWSAAQAAGLTSNIERESGFNSKASGDGGQAYGLGQWHPDRQRAFAAWAGHDIRQSTMLEQLEFMTHELTEGAEKKAGELLKRATDAGSAGAIVSKYYERPGDAAGEAALRGDRANQILQSNGAAAPVSGPGGVTVAQTTTITVTGVADPQEAANKITDGQARANADLLRNFQGTMR